VLELEEGVHRALDGAHPETASRDQDGGLVRREAVLGPHRPDVLRLGEHRVDRDPGDRDRCGRHAEVLQVDAGFLEGDEVGGSTWR